MNIYVGNLNRRLKEQELKSLFEQHGDVASVKIIKDQYTGESRGFGFIEMENEVEAELAIKNLNDSVLDSRNLIVNPAKPKTISSSKEIKNY